MVPGRVFMPEDIQPGALDGKVIVVTGGNTGIGLETVKHLAKAGAQVFLAARTESKAKAAIDSIEPADVQARVKYVHLDLTDISSAKKAAKELMRSNDRLDIVVCNAGIMITPYELTKDGIEQQIGTNHIGHFAFVTELMPLLLKTAEQTKDVRVITVSSLGHWFTLRPASGVHYRSIADLNASCGPDLLPLGSARRYGFSKAANILFAYEIERRYGSRGVHGIPTHPGIVGSDLYNNIAKSWPILWNYIIGPLYKNLLFTSLALGATPALYASTAPIADVSGEKLRNTWVEPGGKVGAWFTAPNAIARSEGIAKELWELSEAVVKDKSA